MNIEFNPSIGSVQPNSTSAPMAESKKAGKGDFAKDVMKSLKNVNETQSDANTSIVDLLSGKNQDVNSVVASVAKADMSFKLLVGVRNKLVEAYKETMRMQL